MLTPIIATTLVVICIGSTIYAQNAGQWEERRIANRVAQTANNYLRIMDVINSMLEERVHGGMRLLMDKCQSLGKPSISEDITVSSHKLPNLMFGTTSLTGQYLIPDSVARAVGGSQTLFARKGDDFVRVSTNVIQDNERVIGTLLDRNSQPYKAIRKGTGYYGFTYILNEPYLASYEPIIGENGSVTGIWYVGFHIDMQLLKDLSTRVALPGDGFIAALDSHGNLHSYSPNTTPEKVHSMAARRNPDWNVVQNEFIPWNFTLITAYPKNAVGISLTFRFVLLFSIFSSGALIVLGLTVYLIDKLVLKPLGGQPSEVADNLNKFVNAENADIDIPLKRGDTSSFLAALNVLQQRLRNIFTPIRQHANDISAQAREVEEAAKQALENKTDDSLIDLQVQLKSLRRATDMLNMSVEQIPPCWVQGNIYSYTFKSETSGTETELNNSPQPSTDE